MAIYITKVSEIAIVCKWNLHHENATNIAIFKDIGQGIDGQSITLDGCQAKLLQRNKKGVLLGSEDPLSTLTFLEVVSVMSPDDLEMATTVTQYHVAPVILEYVTVSGI